MGQVVSNALADCHKSPANEPDTEFARRGMAPEDAAHDTAAMPIVELPKLGLRVFADPCQELMEEDGAICAPFLTLGKEVIATELEKVKGWDALRARFERSAKERAGVRYSQEKGATAKLQWPEGYRFTAARRFWRAKIISQDDHGMPQESICMLVVANAPEDRTIDNVELDLQDSADTARYCARYNQQLKRCFGESNGVPGVRVCAPVGCEVIKSNNTQFASSGEAVTILPYPFPEVKKFVFDGSEDFLEIPQAFFHHAVWLSGGRENVCDIQGIEDDDSNVLLIDPCIIRTAKPTVTDLLSTIAAGGQSNGKIGGPEVEGPSGERFDMLHPRCSQLCKVFDPNRRSAARGRHCGLNIACGLK
jgi:hypothetical protein